MQSPSLKLQEIIWEITGQCKNGCDFCGSKDVWKEKINNSKILSIAKHIAEFEETAPEEIDISGGDPLLVDFEIHKKVIEILKEANILCKIVINPKSACRNKMTVKTKKVIKDIAPEKIKILKLYDHVGVSINSKKEAEDYRDLLGKIKCTVITNFNLSNIFHFDKIAEVVRAHNVPWMVQFTVYREPSDLSLYEDKNEEGLSYLCERIQNGINGGINIVISDNANNGSCTAGTRSLGILSNGDVVPCLSMRCWLESKDIPVQGNILKTSLPEIWNGKFSDYRYREFKCCKDHCNNKCIFFVSNPTVDLGESDSIIFNYPPDGKLPINPPISVLYGVIPSPRPWSDGGTNIYACPTPDTVTIMYGAFTGEGTSDWDTPTADPKPHPRRRGRGGMKFMYGTIK